MSLVIDITTKDSLLHYHIYSDDGFRVRKIGTEVVLDEAWEPYYVGSPEPEYEEIYEKREVKEEVKEEVEDNVK